MKHILICLLILLISAPVKADIASPTDKVKQDTKRTYDLTIPEAWKKSISFGELTINCNAFYGVPWFLGLYPVVRLNLPVENLTTDKLYLKINYTTKSKVEGYGNSGMGSYYMLEPR